MKKERKQLLNSLYGKEATFTLSKYEEIFIKCNKMVIYKQLLSSLMYFDTDSMKGEKK